MYLFLAILIAPTLYASDGEVNIENGGSSEYVNQKLHKKGITMILHALYIIYTLFFYLFLSPLFFFGLSDFCNTCNFFIFLQINQFHA